MIHSLIAGAVLLHVAVAGKVEVVGDAPGLAGHGLGLDPAKLVVTVGHRGDAGGRGKGQEPVDVVVAAAPDFALRVGEGGEITVAVVAVATLRPAASFLSSRLVAVPFLDEIYSHLYKAKRLCSLSSPITQFVVGLKADNNKRISLTKPVATEFL